MNFLRFLVISVGALATAPAAAATPDVLVVCPGEFRAALAPWEELRHSQGHELLVIDVPPDAETLRATIRQTAAKGRLQYVVLIGDAPGNVGSAPALPPVTTPTNFMSAKINVRWGSEPEIATDYPYADLDGDGLADLAIGRIPADSAEELAAVVRKIVRYERDLAPQIWERKLSALAGVAGFSPLVDAMIEVVGQQLIQQALPAGFVVNLERANTITPTAMSASRSATNPEQPRGRDALRRQLSAGCLAWIYLGHGDRTGLDFEMGSRGPESLLNIDQLPEVQCGGHCPLAILMTCSAGAFDSQPDCLAERLLLAEDGPVAVIASTRVSLPYGNTILGYEMLRAGLSDRPETLGQAMKLAQNRVLNPRPDDALRTSLEGMARGLSPLAQRSGVPWQPEDLAAERREHAAMYHILGDPLLRWRRPAAMELAVASEVTAGDILTVDGRAEWDGDCLVELTRFGGETETAKTVVAQAAQLVRPGQFRVRLTVPEDASGNYVVRAFLHGQGGTAVGGANVVVRAVAPSP